MLGEVALRPETPVDLVGGDVKKAEACRPPSPVPLPEACLEKPKGPHHVCLDKGLRPDNGAVHVGLGGEVHHAVEVLLCKQAVEQSRIPDVAVDKSVPASLRGGKILEVRQISGLGERIQVDETPGRPHCQGMANDIAADEPGAASYEQRGFDLGHSQTPGRSDGMIFRGVTASKRPLLPVPSLSQGTKGGGENHAHRSFRIGVPEGQYVTIVRGNQASRSPLRGEARTMPIRSRVCDSLLAPHLLRPAPIDSCEVSYDPVLHRH